MLKRIMLSVSAVAMLVQAAAATAPIPANANDSPLAVVPASSPIVVQVKGFDRVKGRLRAFLTAAAPDFGALAAAQIESALVNLPEGRKIKGLAPNGPLFITFLTLPTPDDDKPAVALVARVTKFAEFRDGLLKEDERTNLKTDPAGYETTEVMGQPIYFVDRRDYGIVTIKKEVAEVFAKNYQGIDGQLSKELATRILENDVSVYVNLAAVNRTFGDQIRQARDLFMSLMDQNVGGLDKNSAEMAKKMYAGMFQAVLDGRSFVGSVDFRPEGLAAHLQAQVGSESDANQLLKDQKPSRLDQVGRLPAGLMTYTAAEFSPDMMKSFSGAIQGLMPTEGDAKKSWDAIAAAKGKANYSAVTYPMSGITFQEYGDVAKAFAGTVGMFEHMDEGHAMGGSMVKGKPEIKRDAETYRDIKFTSYRVVWDLDKMAEMMPGGTGDAVKQGMKKLMGDEMRGWIGVSGNRLINVMGKDWGAAKARLDQFLDGKNPVGEAEPFQSTRKQLPADSSMLFMMDAGPMTFAMADYMLTMFKAMPLPINLPEKMTPVKTNTSFIGAAITLQPENGSLDLFVPAASVGEIRKVIMQLFQGGS